MSSIRIYLGVGALAIALAILAFAWIDDDVVQWYIGVLTFVAGLLLILSGARKPKVAPIDVISTASYPKPSPIPWEQSFERPPLLGELLVYKYQYISSEALQRALEIQRGRTVQLGDILVQMGEITPEQLKKALADQERYKDASWISEPWAMRRFDLKHVVIRSAKEE